VSFGGKGLCSEVDSRLAFAHSASYALEQLLHRRVIKSTTMSIYDQASVKILGDVDVLSAANLFERNFFRGFVYHVVSVYPR
jgi:hypothetical protein